MSYLLMLSGVFALAVAINCTSLWHVLAILPAWLSFIYLASQLDRHLRLNFYENKWFGLIVIIVAVTMFILALQKVGTQALYNGNFFGKGKITNDGIYKHLKNPIYDSYWILLVGLGLYMGNGAYLILAVESFIGLNTIEAYFERHH